VHGQAFAVESPVGWMPRFEDLDWKGLEFFPSDSFYDLMAVGPRRRHRPRHTPMRNCSTASATACPKSSPLSANCCAQRLWRSPDPLGTGARISQRVVHKHLGLTLGLQTLQHALHPNHLPGQHSL
jgi:hypothetical protein